MGRFERAASQVHKVRAVPFPEQALRQVLSSVKAS